MTRGDQIRPDPPAAVATPAFERILCAVDGSEPSLEAARQAALIAGSDSKLSLLAIAPDDDGAEAVRAEQALEEAARYAAERALEASGRFARSGNPVRLILDASAECDLLVVGSRARSRMGGILLGSTASAAVHAAPVPVLVARRPPEGRELLGQVLVATDGSRDARRGVELTAAIARAHGSRVALVHVHHRSSEPHRRLAEDAITIMDAIGVEPVTIEESGDPHERIAEVARRERASLLVMGSRGLGGVRALGSVSERVAHEAPCSVLIVRPRGG